MSIIGSVKAAIITIFNKINRKIFFSNSLLSVVLSKWQPFYPKVPELQSMITKMIIKEASIARFGDGEFNLCFGESIVFQNQNTHLRKRLLQILKNPGEKCLVCIPELQRGDTLFWDRYWRFALPRVIPLLNQSYAYGNMGISRQLSINQIQRLSKTWQNHNVLFIFGKGSRFNIESDLFTKVRSKTILLGKPENAYVEYDYLFESAKKQLKVMEEPRLAILSLGPTATVLAWDLSESGFRALDLGHITNVYNRLMGKAGEPEELPKKIT